jgi:CRP-like cAMP-binding protein
VNARAETKAQLPQLGRDRRSEARRLIDAMEHAKELTEGHFSALGMLITDASLNADEPALAEVKDGLQWLHRGYLDTPALDGDQRERGGRLLGLIDCAHWALQRLPSGLQLGLHPDGHAARFLAAVARRQGMSNQDLAAELGTDETEVSRVGRKLLSAGVVWKRKEWRHNAWDITPRGLQYVQSAGLLKDEPVPAASRTGHTDVATRRGVDDTSERSGNSRPKDSRPKGERGRSQG